MHPWSARTRIGSGNLCKAQVPFNRVLRPLNGHVNGARSGEAVSAPAWRRVAFLGGAGTAGDPHCARRLAAGCARTAARNGANCSPGLVQVVAVGVRSSGSR